MDYPRLTRNREKEIVGLTQGKFRKSMQQYFVEGLRAVESALSGNAEVVELIVTHEMAERAAHLLDKVPTYLTDSAGMKRMSDTKTAQGIIAVAKLPDRENVPPKFPMLVLDGVQDPGNVGGIIRSAAWFGIPQIVIGPGTADPYSPKVVRASMGGLWDVDIISSDDLSGFLKDQRGLGHPIYGADLEGESVHAWRPSTHSVLVLGSEAHGLSPGIREIIDQTVQIDGADHRRSVESLNVGVATGILLFQWTIDNG